MSDSTGKDWHNHLGTEMERVLARPARAALLLSWALASLQDTPRNERSTEQARVRREIRRFFRMGTGD